MNVNISGYEIAKLFGLIYVGDSEHKDSYGDTRYTYDFDFHGKEIKVACGWGVDDAVNELEAKEEAAERVLFMIGKAAAEMDNK